MVRRDAQGVHHGSLQLGRAAVGPAHAAHDYRRAKRMSQEELAGLLQMDQSPGALNTLKALVHRARTDLDQLEPGAGLRPAFLGGQRGEDIQQGL